MTLNLDILAFGAHPDDVELVAGGTLLKMAEQGYKTGIIDMTRGERGTRGSPEIRAREARASARILKLRMRENLSMEDAQIATDGSSRLKVIDTLRRFRPRIVITHYWEDPHPDHRATSEIVTDACFLAGLMRIETGQPRFRPKDSVFHAASSCHAHPGSGCNGAVRSTNARVSGLPLPDVQSAVK